MGLATMDNTRSFKMILTPEARQARDWAIEKGIPIDSIDEIIETVLDQEVVAYCSENGTVTFDVSDLIWEMSA